MFYLWRDGNDMGVDRGGEVIKLTWEGLRKYRVMRAFLTQKILRGFTVRIGLPLKWSIRIATWMWLRGTNSKNTIK
jgi:hypothetical protein